MLVLVFVLAILSGMFLFIKENESKQPISSQQIGQESIVSQNVQSLDTSNWKVYRNVKYGIEFRYPPPEDGWTLSEYEDKYPMGQVATGVRVYYDYKRIENSPKRGEMFNISFVESPFNDLYLKNSKNPNLFFFDFNGEKAVTYENDKDLIQSFLNYGKCNEIIVFGLPDLSHAWALGGQVSIECDASYALEQHKKVLKAILGSIHFF